jgi:hypothetical protein
MGKERRKERLPTKVGMSDLEVGCCGKEGAIGKWNTKIWLEQVKDDATNNKLIGPFFGYRAERSSAGDREGFVWANSTS